MAETKQAAQGEVTRLVPWDLPSDTTYLGKTTVRWWEGLPGKAVIMAKGGSVDDRSFAEQYIRLALAFHGYERQSFTFDWPKHLRKQAAWPDIMAKAKRLIQSGNVTLLRNGYNNIVAHVIGDHGEYNVEIGRDDPTSRAISTWQCECPWDQYAWQRTRQWKKYEGRPCAHVLAAYWTSLATPLDEDVSPDQAMGMGTGQKLPPSAPPGGAPAPAPAPVGAPSPFAQEPAVGGPSAIPPDPTGGMGPDVGMAPPSPAGVLPASPMEQLQQMQPPMPGQTPAGMPAPPNSVSVPGARLPGPFNPIQYPGGTYSRTADWERVAADFVAPEIVRLKNEVYGLAEGKSEGGGAGQYQPVQPGARGEVLSQDETTGWVEVIFPLDGGPLTPYHVRCFVEPSDLTKTDIRPPGPFIRRRR